MQFIDIVADDDGVTRVRPTLIANDDLEIRGEEVNQLSLCFVAPLQTNDTSSWHC